MFHPMVNILPRHFTVLMWLSWPPASLCVRRPFSHRAITFAGSFTDPGSSPINISESVQALQRSHSFVPDLRNPTQETLNAVAPQRSIKKYWNSFVKAISPASGSALATLIAKVIVWGVGNALTIAFPPAALGITIGVAFATFLVTAASFIARDGGLGTLSSWAGFCELIQEVNVNMFVGLNGGVGAAIPALILSVDALDMVVSEYKDVPGLGSYLHGCVGLAGLDLKKALDEIRARRGQTAEDLIKILPWTLDPTMGGCRCIDCGACGTKSLYCSDKNCFPFYHLKCELHHKSCTVLRDCFENNEVEMRLAHPKLLKLDDDGLAIANNPGLDFKKALDEVRATGGQTAEDLIKILPRTLDPTMGGCRCIDCGACGTKSEYCSDKKCFPFYHLKCELDHKSCTVLRDCFENDEVEMRLAHPKLLKLDDDGLAIANNPGLDLKKALDEVRATGGQTAEDLIKILPRTLDPTMGGCRCIDCGASGAKSEYCSKHDCFPFYYLKCELDHKSCTVLRDCFENDEVKMRLAHPKLLKLDEVGGQ